LVKGRSAVCGEPALLKMIFAGCVAEVLFCLVPSHFHFQTFLPFWAVPR
jgi:hypothetical protein